MDTLRDATEIFPAYEQLLDARNIPAKAKPYYLRWAKAWITTAESDNPSAAQEFFQCLGRRANLPAWQFQQAVRAVAWLARDILHIPWAESFDWRGLADQAKPLEPDHRTLGPAVAVEDLVAEFVEARSVALVETDRECSGVGSHSRVFSVAV